MDEINAALSQDLEAVDWYLTYMSGITPDGGKLMVTLMGRAMLLVLQHNVIAYFRNRINLSDDKISGIRIDP